MASCTTVSAESNSSRTGVKVNDTKEPCFKEVKVGIQEDGVSGGETAKKKNRGKKLSKAERKRRKEEEAIKKIRGPKDSHIQLISADILQKHNDANRPGPSKSSSTGKGYVFSQDEFPSVTSAPFESPKQSPLVGKMYPEEFPSLVAVAKHYDKLPRVKTKEFRDVTENIPSREPKASKVRTCDSDVRNTCSCTEESQVDTQFSVSKDEESGWETENENPLDNEKAQTSGVAGSVSSNKVETVPASSKKKSKNPFIISLETLIHVNKTDAAVKRREAKKSKVVKKETTVSQKKTVGNMLDASGPVLIKRGKMREKPKKKKLTALKKAILISRTMRSSKSIDHGSKQELAESTTTNVNSPAINGNTDTMKSSTLDFNGDSTAEGSNLSPLVASENANPNSAVQGECKTSENVPSSEPVGENSSSEGEITKDEILSSSSSKGSRDAEACVISQIKQETSQLSQNENLFAALLDNAIKSQQNIGNEVEPEPEPKQEEELASSIILEAKKTMHSRKFRPYCNMYVSKELHGHLIALMKELHRFQDRLYHTDPIKFQSKRRYVHGLKDTINYLEINKVCLVILAPDVESNNVKGGLDDKISTIIRKAATKDVPVIFSGNRFILGKLIMIKSQVSAIAVLDKQGAEELFRTVICESTKLRDKYQSDLDERVQQILSEQNSLL